jgi:hypothetical protein
MPLTESTMSTFWQEERWKNVGLLAHNMRTHVSHDGCEGILHNIMGCCPLPTINITKKVNPHKV